MTARYSPMRTKIGMQMATTATKAGQSADEKTGVPALKLKAAHKASGIMIESAQIAIIRFNGPGRSMVCRAKSSVLSTLFESKVSLPDTYPLTAVRKLFDFAADKDFLNLPYRTQCTELIQSITVRLNKF